VSLALPSGPPEAAPEAALIALWGERVPRDPSRIGMTILSTTVETSGAGPALKIALRADPALHEPDVFVEGPDVIASGPARIVSHPDDASTVLLVPIRSVRPVALTGQRLELTLVDGDRAAQFPACPRAGPSSD
jgi:hypothetical protein